MSKLRSPSLVLACTPTESSAMSESASLVRQAALYLTVLSHDMRRSGLPVSTWKAKAVLVADNPAQAAATAKNSFFKRNFGRLALLTMSSSSNRYCFCKLWLCEFSC
ncbi:hypothetical protein D3C80_1517650 [compost metagenome]